MTKTITIGKRLIPIEHIALVEGFDPDANPNFRPERAYKGRVVLVDRESVLVEQEPKAFAEAHGFRMVRDDNVALNPDIRFNIETFVAADGFNPTKPYQSRLVWRDNDDMQSKLMLAAPVLLLAIAVRGELEESQPIEGEPAPESTPARRRSRRQRPAATPT